MKIDTIFKDLIPTINDDEDVEDYSEESDAEVEVRVIIYVVELFITFSFQFQPSKQKRKKLDFNKDFEFVSSIEEYNKDAWNDITKFVKRKAKQKTDDKIKKLRLAQDVFLESDNDQKKDDNNSDLSLSEDELKHDRIQVKKKRGKNVTENSESFFEEVDLNTEENSSFYQMNLSRPLLKAIAEMKFVHPTPIQAVTIPVALLGNIFLT